MKTNNIKALSLGVSAAIVSTGAAIAGLPTNVDFEQWSINNNTALNPGQAVITATCPVGFTCSTVATDDGFLQRTVYDGTDTLVQTIVTDREAGMRAGLQGSTNVTFSQLDFADESFVRMSAIGAGGSSNGGIADRSRTGNRNALDNSFDFEQNATLLTGTFWTDTDVALGKSNFDVNQVVSGVAGGGTAATDFFTAFNFSKIEEAMGAGTGLNSSTLNIAQKVVSVPTIPASVGGEAQKQNFIFSRLTGAVANTTSDFGVAMLASSMTVGGKTIAAVSGAVSSVEAVWIGQNFGASGFGVEQVRDTSDGGFTELGRKVSWATVGFPAGTVASKGFDWNTALGDTIYAPKF